MKIIGTCPLKMKLLLECIKKLCFKVGRAKEEPVFPLNKSPYDTFMAI